MNNCILIIDDEKIQAQELSKSLNRKMSDTSILVAFDESTILDYVENKFYDIAIVDLRMDKFSINGFSVIRKIIKINPFAKIIIVSAYTLEYSKDILEIISSNKISAVIEKKEPKLFIPEIIEVIDSINNSRSKTDTQKDALIEYYKNAKNEVDANKKGIKFEYFVSLLFSKMGFNKTKNRVIDKSLNETDLIVRNDISDIFFQKFGAYIFVECKNKPNSKINKNDFIVFYSKVKNSNGLSNLGVFFSSGNITYNTYYEALRNSGEMPKIIFVSNKEIYQLIESNNMLEELKNIIDEQIKDN